jgi:hypothetical protein
MCRDDIPTAIDHRSETESVEFKASFDPASSAEWIEIIKDVVALANSGGGVIIFGVADDGTFSDFDCGPLSKIDPADLTNKIAKYSGQQFAGFEFVDVACGERRLFAILITAVRYPLVFCKAGTYDIGGGKQKTGFSAGTVYFRHGAKSEPANTDDLRAFVERCIEVVRKSWLDGIVKVVEAPAGSHVQIIEQPVVSPAPSAIRLVNDPSAPAFQRFSVDESHPYRQKEVCEQVNKLLNGTRIVRPHHIQYVRQAHNIDDDPTFCYRQKYATARYSVAFVEWVFAQYQADKTFFEAAKVKLDEQKRAAAAAA